MQFIIHNASLTMKKIFFAALSLFTAAHIQAQDSFTNYQMVNTTDVFGTARYTAMGGAMGALGADISAMSNNPASIALFRKNDVSVSMGGQIQDAKPFDADSRGRFSFDQVGFVACFSDDDGFGSFNFGLNFQKKSHFGNSFFVEGPLGRGLTQTNQLANIYENYYMGYQNARQNSLYCRAFDALLWDLPDGVGFTPKGYDYNRLTSGNQYGLDLNFSGNIQERIYLGATVGVDFMTYRSNQRYVEYRDGSDGSVQDYDLSSNRRVDGTGFNVKLGAIFRPIEESPLRFGITVETPTWYVMTQKNSYFSFASKWEYIDSEDVLVDGRLETVYNYNYLDQPGDYAIYDSYDDNFLDFNIFTPWRFRAQLGSTVSNYLAWDVEYEYAMYDYTKLGYPEGYNADGPTVSMDKDTEMGKLTHASINGVHNIRAGLEIKPVAAFAARIGYNYWSRPMKSNAVFDQGIDSWAMDYVLGTEWMNLGATNMFSFGIGFRHKGFYADLAYKYRAQNADFYAFDDSWGGTAGRLQPARVNLDRHGFNITLGYRF